MSISTSSMLSIIYLSIIYLSYFHPPIYLCIIYLDLQNNIWFMFLVVHIVPLFIWQFSIGDIYNKRPSIQENLRMDTLSGDNVIVSAYYLIQGPPYPRASLPIQLHFPVWNIYWWRLLSLSSVSYFAVTPTCIVCFFLLEGKKKSLSLPSQIFPSFFTHHRPCLLQNTMSMQWNFTFLNSYSFPVPIWVCNCHTNKNHINVTVLAGSSWCCFWSHSYTLEYTSIY